MNQSLDCIKILKDIQKRNIKNNEKITNLIKDFQKINNKKEPLKNSSKKSEDFENYSDFEDELNEYKESENFEDPEDFEDYEDFEDPKKSKKKKELIGSSKKKVKSENTEDSDIDKYLDDSDLDFEDTKNNNKINNERSETKKNENKKFKNYNEQYDKKCSKQYDNKTEKQNDNKTIENKYEQNDNFTNWYVNNSRKYNSNLSKYDYLNKQDLKSCVNENNLYDVPKWFKDYEKKIKFII
jgi:hypothetical protein